MNQLLIAFRADVNDVTLCTYSFMGYHLVHDDNHSEWVGALISLTICCRRRIPVSATRHKVTETRLETLEVEELSEQWQTSADVLPSSHALCQQYRTTQV